MIPNMFPFRLPILLILCFMAGIAHGQEPAHPLQPPDRSSPRATLKTFLDSADALGAFLAREYLTTPSRAQFQRLIAAGASPGKLSGLERNAAGGCASRPAGRQPSLCTGR